MIGKIINKLSNGVAEIRRRRKYSRSRKIFCIGRNKTGTTSMAVLLKDLGFEVATQKPFELLLSDWKKEYFDRIIDRVKYSGEAFQDIPFSLPETYKVLDREFPNSKFILTIRDSPEVWYRSITTFHAKKFGNGQIPTKENLENAEYVYRGWMWELNRIYDTPLNDVYNKTMLIQHYTDYNKSVVDYFQGSPDKLLVVNLKEEDAAIKVSKFLGSGRIITNVPWENKT